jgi:ubiquitin carboxyl-terminal hydrolase 4/11/15
MNSGLQCLSNTPELTKYFVTDCHLQDLNKENPDGLYGKLAVAFGSLLKDMWTGSGGGSKLAPKMLKNVLGKKIKRFLG